MSPKDRPHQKKHLRHFESALEEPEAPGDSEPEQTWEEINVIDFGVEDRIIVRRVEGTTHQLVDFALQQETKVEGSWRPIRRYDCCHDMVHLDKFHVDGTRDEAVRICSLDQIEMGYQIAEDAIYDRWEAEKERFLRG